MKKQEYTNKIFDFIHKEKIQRLKTDPTNKFQLKIKALLKSTNVLFTDLEKYHLTEMNPRPPRLYGLLKIHKDNAPIRPLVSHIGCPAHKLAKKLCEIIVNLTGFESKFRIKNSLELSKQLIHLDIKTGYKSAPLDITNMFGNISGIECSHIISELLDQKSINPIIKDELLKCLEIVLNQNYFEFNKKFFKQTFGLSMGSPLSPLLAEIFMANFEVNKVINTPLAKQHIICWYRYVDDVFVCFDGSNRQLNNFVEHINSLNPKIQFSTENELEDTLCFLDLKIKKMGNSLVFDVYRKPTFTDTTIPVDSLHHPAQKMAAFNSMIHRALSLPLSQANLKKEIETITQIATNNGFDRQLIYQILKRRTNNIAKRAIYSTMDKESTRYNSITYYGKISVKIGNILSSYNIKPAFKPPVKLGNIILNNKSKIDKEKQSGIYQLSCSGCEGVYVGQTGRSFQIREREHLRCFRNNKDESTFATHLLETGHQPNAKMDILHITEKGCRMNVLEGLEIYKCHKSPKTLLNDQKDAYYSSLFSALI